MARLCAPCPIATQKTHHMPSLCFSSRILTALLMATTLMAGCGGGSKPSASVGASSSQNLVTASIDSAGPPAPEPILVSKLLAESADTPSDVVLSPEVSTFSALEPQTFSINSFAIAAAATAAPATGPALDIFVATNGNDSWSGSIASPNAGQTDGPKRTIAGAQSVARLRLAEMNAGALRRAIIVQIGPGEYRLSSALVFGVTDSGVPGSPVTYRATTPGTVTISGAQVLGTVTASAAGSVLSVPGPAANDVAMRGGTQLFVDGRRATLARSPNAGGYWFVQKALPLDTEPAGQTGMEAFAPPADGLAFVNGLSATDRSRALVKVMQSWTSGRHRLSALAAPAGGIRVTPRAPWAFLNFGVDQRFYIENVPSALDAPGEWIWEGSTVRYIATAADVGKTVKLEMPFLERLLIISGNEPGATWVQDLQFQGLTFANTRLLTPDAGFADRQAGSTISAAVELYAARRIVFDNCTFTRTGGYGLWFVNSVRDSTVSNSQFNDLGAGGVKIGITSQSANYANGTGANTVFGNKIIDNGKLIPGAVGIWIGQSFDNVVSNNLIANTTYTGISVGWSWQYGVATSGRNLITKNLLFNIGQGALSDLGAIYTVGESPGTVISGNVIQEVRPYPGYGAGAWGLYNDEATTGALLEQNIVIGTSTGGYLLHRGRNNTVRTNILAGGDRSEVQVALSDPANTKLSFTNNLLLPKVTVPLQWFATAPDVIYSGNKVSTLSLPSALDLTKCNGGCSTVSVGLSVGADPRVITLTGADAATTAWVASVTAQVGPPGWVVATAPPVVTTPPPVVVAPPIGFELDLAGTAIGARPPKLTYRTGPDATAISVSGGVATPSGKCLKFVDSPTNPNRYDPHAWSTLNHTVGTSTVEFSILIDANTNFLHEWRDDATTFLIGPSLRITTKGIEVGGKIIAPTTVGSWMTFKVTAGLGTSAGTWSLAVTNAAGATTNYSNLALKSTGWNRLNWLGFVSDSAITSNTCIGFIKALNPGS